MIEETQSNKTVVFRIIKKYWEAHSLWVGIMRMVSQWFMWWMWACLIFSGYHKSSKAAEFYHSFIPEIYFKRPSFLWEPLLEIEAMFWKVNFQLLQCFEPAHLHHPCQLSQAFIWKCKCLLYLGKVQQIFPQAVLIMVTSIPTPNKASDFICRTLEILL